MFKDVYNDIALRRKSKVFVATGNDTPTVGLVGALMENVMGLGFRLTGDLVAVLSTRDDTYLFEFHKWLTKRLREAVGAHKTYRPMYPGFPQQVADALYEDLLMNAEKHYASVAEGRTWVPTYEGAERPDLLDRLNGLKPIGLAVESVGADMFVEVLTMKTSPSDVDKQDIDTFIKQNCPFEPQEVPNKEVLCYAFASAEKQKSPLALNLAQCVKTSTDVLRIAVGLSGGDVSLSERTTFVNFKRPMRRKLLSMLNTIDVNQGAEDMMRFRATWKRLGEKLHPGEFSARYPDAFEMFRLARNEGVKTFNAKVEGLIKNGQISEAAELLSKRPGDFARRLDKMLRAAQNPDEVLVRFREVAEKVSSPVLWQIYGHFASRDEMQKMKTRIFFPKGKMTKAMEVPNNMADIGTLADQARTVCIQAIMGKLAELPEMGKVFVDPIVEGLLIPLGNRSASTSLRTVGRGSRFKLSEDKDTLRLFMWWKNIESGDQYDSRVDLDLSAVEFDKDFNFIGQVSYTNLCQGSGKNAVMVHSGDETDGRDGVSEFIDVNIPKLPSRVAYIVFTVTSYTGQKLEEMDEAFVGWMQREEPKSGEIYDPATVQGRVDLRTPATQVAPVIFDVKKREMVWADMASMRFGYGYNVENTKDATSLACDAVTRMGWARPALADLFYAHITARGGSFTDVREDADFVIAEDGDLSPFDAAKIASEYM